MSESNTPPENQKKKSAFSRFFSRKKNKNTEQEADTEVLSQDQAQKTESTQDDKPAPIKDASIKDSEPTVTEKIVAKEDTNPVVESSIAQPTAQEVAQTTPEENQKPSTDSEQASDSTPDTAQPEQSEFSNHSPAPVNNTTESPATVEQGLTKSRTSFFQKVSNVFKSSFNLDDDLFDELEELLITSDIGIEASLNLVENLRARVKKEKIQDAKGVVTGLRQEITNMLLQSEQDWQFAQKPYVILMVGVNGAGKTTTTAKIAKHFQDQGKSVMLAAADTFRAAAVEQLQEWGKRLDIPVIAQAHGSDAAAVAHDALTSAIAKNIDILMIDTAGRLHTQSDLMEQLTKVNRVLAKIDPSTPHEVMQVLDAGTGQNALIQLEHFQKAVGVSSICLSKLDGSAKGGIAISLSEKTKLPIRFIGVGEGFSDLRRFSASQFADALIPDLD